MSKIVEELTLGQRLDAALVKLHAAQEEVASLREIILRTTSLFPGVKISARERQILMCVNRGMQNKEIANKLNSSVRTVKFHVSSLLRKFGVLDRTELLRKVGDEEYTKASITVMPIDASRTRSA